MSRLPADSNHHTRATHTPRGSRLHVVILGKRNVGKSSLLNALLGQAVSIVSDVPGTTTDAVEKAAELQPLGPVQWIDTAGLDDQDANLGSLRQAATRRAIDRADVGILVTAAGAFDAFERTCLQELASKNTGIVVAVNKCDLVDEAVVESEIAHIGQTLQTLGTKHQAAPVVACSAAAGRGIDPLRDALIKAVPDSFAQSPVILSDLVPPGKVAVLVTPIDPEAPKGRLILPQVQSIRDLLDGDAICMVVKERELREALSSLAEDPALVVTDSQAFLKVAADTPSHVPMTSFSILFARLKGDLNTFVNGVRAIDTLRDGDRVLLAEACSHHPVAEDIGRVKIPRWLRQYTGAQVQTQVHAGHDLPDDLSPFKLVIHCGGCMSNRQQLLTRIERSRSANVPITNYGVNIAYTLGILERALSPLPGARLAYQNAR